MPRYRLLIEYDGTSYHGWQRQRVEQPSVQQAIEQAALAFSGETVRVASAGRTDAGVHARGQTGHVDFARNWKPDTVRDALNAHLGQAGHTIAIVEVCPVADDFDARFSAIRRHYIYRIVNRRAPLALERHQAWHVARPLDADAMHDAAQALVGRHDFTTFRSIQCQAKSPVRTLERLDVIRHGELVEIHASARSFLHNQIRSFAGTLKRVGEGAWNCADVKAALEAKDRRHCGPVAPPHGLYFMQVDYD
ncbi:tRNA pseudouridine(38-40) synthase TruA [Limoniibacter endophyticus]|uniref:tRNA pseudouridine synthase A n=1 Tax=Limoniibacter endophyticus TaxID=1565040 RepID=A0A8J3DGD6_9HYPH|nr:tRNA pseudouridine(38-40) synthase TruA [Limoniibacter endophyticus]GHC67329.1 tRNA pseudouridine synthase A [Limoniibacter endophyticus]